jgi:hypothetical protein
MSCHEGIGANLVNMMTARGTARSADRTSASANTLIQSRKDMGTFFQVTLHRNTVGGRWTSLTMRYLPSQKLPRSFTVESRGLVPACPEFIQGGPTKRPYLAALDARHSIAPI